MVKTIWKSIPLQELDAFEVSDDGQVRKKKGRAGKCSRQKAGEYIAYNFRLADGSCHTILVHRLVLIAFRGPPTSEKPICRHLNGDPQDNRLENLAWGNQSDNCEDAKKHGRLSSKADPIMKIPDSNHHRLVRNRGCFILVQTGTVWHVIGGICRDADYRKENIRVSFPLGRPVDVPTDSVFACRAEAEREAKTRRFGPR